MLFGAKPESLCLLSSSRRGTLLFVFPFAIVRTAYHTFIWTMRDQSAGSSLTPWDYYGVMVNHTTKVPHAEDLRTIVSHFALTFWNPSSRNPTRTILSQSGIHHPSQLNSAQEIWESMSFLRQYRARKVPLSNVERGPFLRSGRTNITFEVAWTFVNFQYLILLNLLISFAYFFEKWTRKTGR